MAVAQIRFLDPRAGRGATAAETDVALVEALRSHAPGAELAAWNRYSASVDRTLRRLIGPGPDREDLLQEVFIRFFRRIDTLREAGAVRGFLTGICIHVVHAEIVARRRRRWLRLTFTGELPEAPVRAADGDAREAVARYYRLLDGLSSKDRSLFVARTIEGLTLEEVAAVHQVSVSTAQRRLRRAAQRIAAQVRRDPVLVQLAAAGPVRETP
jgi:RNA polymerase sigma-70 factor (ECF subfamily)